MQGEALGSSVSARGCGREDEATLFSVTRPPFILFGGGGLGPVRERVL